MHTEIMYIVKITYHPLLPGHCEETSYWEYNNLSDALDKYKAREGSQHQVTLYTCLMTGKKGKIL